MVDCARLLQLVALFIMDVNEYDVQARITIYSTTYIIKVFQVTTLQVTQSTA